MYLTTARAGLIVSLGRIRYPARVKPSVFTTIRPLSATSQSALGSKYAFPQVNCLARFRHSFVVARLSKTNLPCGRQSTSHGHSGLWEGYRNNKRATDVSWCDCQTVSRCSVCLTSRALPPGCSSCTMGVAPECTGTQTVLPPAVYQ